jgi:DNA-binding transcriptional LysR family regulator
MNASTARTDHAAPLVPLRLDLLQAFVVAAEELCMSRTAARLYLSASGVSRRIKALEGDVGAALFERTTRHMQLTPTGRALLPYARTMLLDARQALLVRDIPRRFPPPS